MLGNEGLVWGASRRETPETNENEDIVGIIPLPTTNPCTHVQCMHAHRWTDTSVRTHTDLWPIGRRERAQESQPDPCQPLPSCLL